jgi:hypothetical protein
VPLKGLHRFLVFLILAERLLNFCSGVFLLAVQLDTDEPPSADKATDIFLNDDRRTVEFGVSRLAFPPQVALNHCFVRPEKLLNEVVWVRLDFPRHLLVQGTETLFMKAARPFRAGNGAAPRTLNAFRTCHLSTVLFVFSSLPLSLLAPQAPRVHTLVVSAVDCLNPRGRFVAANVPLSLSLSHSGEQLGFP